jgi:hypothetical protein
MGAVTAGDNQRFPLSIHGMNRRQSSGGYSINSRSMVWDVGVRISAVEQQRRNKRTRWIIPTVQITHKSCVSLINIVSSDSQKQRQEQ